MTALSITSICPSLPSPNGRDSSRKSGSNHAADDSSFGSGRAHWGARSSGDFHVDFFGGVPYADYTTTTGTLRLRTAHTRLDWANHSLIAALDAPLVSPLEPTSYVGLGEPPFAWSGNLWIWLPQVESINRTRLGAEPSVSISRW